MARLPNDPETTFNAGYTAIPKGMASVDDPYAHEDLPLDAAFDPGTMNEADARESGYIQDEPSPDRMSLWGFALVGLVAGAGLWWLYRRGESDVPAWLTAEAMSPVD